MSLLLRLEGEPEDIWITEDGIYKFKTQLQLNNLIASSGAFFLAVLLYYFVGIASAVLFWLIVFLFPIPVLFLLRYRDKEKRTTLATMPLEEALRRADELLLWENVEHFTLNRNKLVKIQMKASNEYGFPKTHKIVVKPSDADSLKAIVLAKIGDRFRIGKDRF